MAFHNIDINGNFPDLEVSIDFTNDPTNVTRIWTDVTTDVRGISGSRAGRNNETGRTEPGELHFLLDNRQGKYDFNNAASPYYPGVKLTRWVRVRAQWAGVAYPLWQGIVELLTLNWPGGGFDSTVDVKCADTMKVLNLYDLVGNSFAAQGTGARVSAIMALIGGLPSSVDTGVSTCAAVATLGTGSGALAQLQAVEAQENGQLFAEGDGTITFQGRYWRQLNSVTAVDVIGDLPGEIPYRSGTMTLDDVDLVNEGAVTTADNAYTGVSDAAASQLSHYKRRSSRTALNSDHSEADGAAQYQTTVYAEPLARVQPVTLLGVSNPSKWPKILAAKNSQKFTWKRRYKNALSFAPITVSLDMFVEQVAFNITPHHQFDVTLTLSPVNNLVFWILGDTTYSVLGTTTIPGY